MFFHEISAPLLTKVPISAPSPKILLWKRKEIVLIYYSKRCISFFFFLLIKKMHVRNLEMALVSLKRNTNMMALVHFCGGL